MSEKFRMLKDVAVQTAKDSRAYGDGYRDGYLEALDDVEQIAMGGDVKVKNFGPEKFVSKKLGVSVPAPVLPEPCVRGIDMRMMKALFQKLDEEVDEFKFEIMMQLDSLSDDPTDVLKLIKAQEKNVAFRIAEEGADVSTMVATILNALGIDAHARQEAQAYVNKHNHERGRN